MASVNDMATVLFHQGKWAEAEPFCREGLDATREEFGYGHQNTVLMTELLVLVLKEQGKVEEAELWMSEAGPKVGELV